MTIWVDRDGNDVGPPMPSSRPGADAVAAGLATWYGAVAVTAALTASLRSRLNRLRNAKWEREFQYLVNDGGGRTNRQP